MAENTKDIDLNQTDEMPVDLNQDSSKDLLSASEDNVVDESSDEIVVENWDDLQYYSSLNDKNYILKLKENTNYYPTNVESTDSQIIFNNNVTIIGAEGAYIGDTSPNARNITYLAMIVPDNSGVGITLKNITFKWIGTRFQPDGVFCQMGGNTVNYIENCYFTNISTNLGHSSILYIKLGDAIVTNCTFINCTTDFGCLSVYNPSDDPTKTCTLARMNVSDSYFEGNYARTEPGCINNCGILVVRNSTFYKNSAFWWAGAIHTHGGANTTLYDCNFTDNLAGWNGGALYTYSYLQIYNTIFIGNNCTTNNGGGAIGACKYLHAPYIIIKDSLFEDNTNNCWGLDELSTSGTGRGGAISLMDEGLLDVRNTTFIKNSASMGTAICAINGGLQMGSPDVIIVGNRFINHTRVGDVLDIRLAAGSYLEISDNYYSNNSFEFKKLRLLSDEKVGDDVVVHIDAELKNPDSFESDILDTTPYDIYVDGVYNKTVTGRTFSIKLKDGETCHVYAIPCISNSVTNEILVGIPKEYIYVSQNLGSDSNDGLNRTRPVKTMAKAIELARTKGNIVVMDGTYNEYNLVVDYNLTITSENNVKFTGNIPIQVQTIFTVTNYSDLSLKGITFDNIVFAANTTCKNKKVILQDSGYLTIEDCTFSKISPSGNTAMVLIESPNVQVYNSNFTNNNKVSVYVILIKSNEFLVDNCTFTNNIASYSSADSLIRTVNTKTGVKGTVSNSIFENNKVKWGCIYFGANSGVPLTVTNTKFIANTVGGTSDHASCIKIEEAPTLRVDECVFKDNINLGTRAAVIYSSGGRGAVYVSNSIIVNNSYANNNHVVFSASTANYLNVYKNLNGNWWGNTLENYNVAPAVYASACSNWIVLNMTANTTNLAYNQKALVSIDLYSAIDRDGNSSFVDASKLPSFDLDVMANNGFASASKISVVKGMVTVEYTLKSYDSGSLTVKCAGIESTINFAWSLVDPEIEIDVENNTYGNPIVISMTVPSDVDTSKFSVKINNDSYNFNKTLTIPKLNTGEYLINLTYSGDAKYNPYTITKLFKIDKANPQLTVVADDVYYPSSAKITVNAGDATGEISIKVGDKTDSKHISSGKAEFIISNLEANNYTVNVTYSGDANYLAGNASGNFKVKKHNSTITISNSNIVVGSDVILTFTVESDASGTVTVDINGKKENVEISQGTATYTIKSISRGLYNIVATYNGDAKYLSSENATQLDVARLNPSLSVVVSSITYGEDAVFTITLNNDASGSVTVIVDGKNKTANVNNGAASLNMSDLTAGNNKQASIIYSGDNNYKPKETSKTFNVAKAKPTITIEASDIKEGQVAIVQITITKGLTGTIELVTPEGTENPNVPRTGLLTRTFEDLAVNQYIISANYGGDTNYLTASATKAFSVTAWDTPQWPNQGYDAKNTEKSPYSSDANGNVAWIKDIDGTIMGNMAIDGVGNIYITTSKGIYSINANDGSTRWIFSSQDAGSNFSGIAISRDVILAPKSGDKLYFINQTTGEQYHNNMYQGSSIFAPIVDNEGNIYISGEYYGYESTKVVVIPYKIWQTSTAPTSIEIGDYNITSSPILVDNRTVFLTTTNVLVGIDLSSKSIIFNNPISSNSDPVVGYGNIIYVISNGTVIGYNVQGLKMCDVKITGTAGDCLSVGENGEIFSINKEGKLFEYSTGDETLIYDFKEPISSRLLVGQDEKLYVGSDSGMFYAIDVEGNLLWKVNLNQSISNSPVMDSNGVIYVVSGNRIVALDNAQLKDSKLTADIKNVTYGENVTVSIDLEREATGKLSIKIGNLYSDESTFSNGKASFVVSNIVGGTHTAEITYSGDNRFKSKTVNVKFSVGKINPTMDVKFNNSINAGQALQIKVTDFPTDATGTVSVSVAGKSNSSNVINGRVNLAISGMAKGEYTVNVTYSGDVNYNGKTITLPLSVGYDKKSFTATSGDVNVGQDVEINISGLPNDANGVVYVTYNSVDYMDHVVNGNAQIKIHDLANGTYDFDVFYINDTKYSADSQRVHVVVSKITPTFTVSASDIYVGDDLVVDVSGLPVDATGLVIASIEDLSENSSVADGKARIVIQNLTDGIYALNVTYVGDNRYNKINDQKTIKISKITCQLVVSLNNINVGDDLVVGVSGLPNDATGQITVLINGISNASAIKNGASTTIIHQRLANGTYDVNVSYTGDRKYDSLNEIRSVNISKITPKMVVIADNEIDVGEDLVIDISGLPKDARVGYIDIVGDITNRGLIKDGSSKVIISNLTAGKYSFYVYFNGDDRYNMVKSEKTVSVNKLLPKMKVIANNIDVGEELSIQIILPGEISDEFVSISINDENQQIIVNNGSAIYKISGLTKGTYNYSVSYGGNNKFEADEYINLVEVGKISIGYDVTVEDISYGESAVVTISNLPDDASGNVTVIVNKNQYSSKVSGGSAVINIPNLDANKDGEEYDAEVRYFDVKYMANSKYVSFNVKRANPAIRIDAQDMQIGEDLNINVILPKDATGWVVVEVDGIVNTVELNEGMASVSVTVLTGGKKTISVSYAGDKNYNSNANSTYINVRNIDPTLSIESDDIKYGENLTVRISLPSDATGNVTVNVDGKVQTVDLIRGSAIASISGLTVGTKLINVSYSGDNRYNLFSGSKSVIVNKLNLTMSVSAENINYGESLNVIVELSDNIDGDIIVSDGKVSKTVKAIDGVASAEITGLTAGSYTITAKFNGNSIYNEASASKTVTVGKIIPNMTVAANDVAYGEDVAINVNLPGDATGDVVISVDGISKTIAIIDGAASVRISNLTSGVKSVNVKYEGDGNYHSTFAGKQITVSRIDTPIIILADDIKYGENLVVTVNLDNRTTGNVIISVDDISQSIKVTNGSATAVIPSLTSGVKVINANYGGDENFNSAVSSKNITVTKSAPTNVSHIDIEIINESKVDISIPNATGIVSIIVDGKQTSAALDKDGNVCLDLNDLAPGNHAVVVVYDGDGTYMPAYSISNIKISGEPVTEPVASKFDEFIIGDDFTVTMTLKDENGNAIADASIKYTVNGVSGNTKTNGKGLLTVAGKSGAVIGVIYEGSEKFIGTNSTFTLNNHAIPSVVKVSSHFNIPGGVITITGYAVDTKAGEEGIYYSTQLLDANGKPVKGVPINFAVNNKIYDRITLDNGSFAPYKLNMQRAGRYTMAFFFSGNDNYSTAFAAVCVDLDKKPITIKASAKTYKASATKKYTVTLSTIVGSSHDGNVHLSPKEVTLTVAGKTYTAKTNSNGKATFNLKITKKGKYTAKINYAGDNTYDEKSKSVKITIK